MRNLINAEPAPLNNYDKAILLGVARAADKAARMLEKAGGENEETVDQV